MAGVADQHLVIQLLVRDGQLQVTTVFTEHIATVPEDEYHKRKLVYFLYFTIFCAVYFLTPGTKYILPSVWVHSELHVT